MRESTMLATTSAGRCWLHNQERYWHKHNGTSTCPICYADGMVRDEASRAGHPVPRSPENDGIGTYFHLHLFFLEPAPLRILVSQCNCFPQDDGKTSISEAGRRIKQGGIRVNSNGFRFHDSVQVRDPDALYEVPIFLFFRKYHYAHVKFP